jgi:hypothetical protein
MGGLEWRPLHLLGSFLHCRLFLVSRGGANEPLSPFYLPDSSPTYFHFCLLVFCFRSVTRSLELSSRTSRGFICLLFAFFRYLRYYSYSFVLFCVLTEPSVTCVSRDPTTSPFHLCTTNTKEGHSASLPALLPLLSRSVKQMPSLPDLWNADSSVQVAHEVQENGISTSPVRCLLCAH